MFEVLTQHAGPQGSFLRSVMYFSGSTIDDVAAAQADVRAFWVGINAITSADFTRTVLPESRVIDPADGTVLSVLAPPVPQLPVTGSVDNGTVPDSTQLLVRWQTDEFVRGRRVRGRTYVPGLSINSMANGNVVGASVNAASAAAAALAIGNGLTVWSRPFQGSLGLPSLPGRECGVSGSSVWNEWAVLTGRRA